MGGIGLTRRWAADVRVSLRDGIADPEGQTIAAALRSLGYATVSEVRSGKLLRIELEAETRTDAEAAVADMCRRLLANPVMEVASWELTPAADPVAIDIGS